MDCATLKLIAGEKSKGVHHGAQCHIDNGAFDLIQYHGFLNCNLDGFYCFSLSESDDVDPYGEVVNQGGYGFRQGVAAHHGKPQVAVGGGADLCSQLQAKAGVVGELDNTVNDRAKVFQWYAAAKVAGLLW